MSNLSHRFSICCAALIALLLPAPHSASAATTEVEGWIDSVWVDRLDRGAQAARHSWILHDDEGSVVLLDGPRSALSASVGKKVRARIEIEDTPTSGTPSAHLVGIEPLAAGSGTTAATAPASGGSRRWVSLLCRFADSPSTPGQEVDHFAGMYAADPHRLPDYWRQVSYGQLEVTGAAAGWFTLPKTKAEYLWNAYPDRDYGALFRDCTQAADGEIDFSQVDGINLFFDDSDERSFGGHWTATLDGKTRTWPTTWLTSAAQLLVVAHEMGHALGLPHSNNSDRDTDPYDSPWDVMSMPPTWCPQPRCDNGACYEAGYGEVPQETIGYHRQILGWLPSQAIVSADPARTTSVTLSPLADSAAPTPRLIEVAIPGTNRFYTVEVRVGTGYDETLPRSGVIIHEVDPERLEPAWLVARTTPPADQSCDAGSVWRAGDELRDPSGFSIRVAEAAGAGYRVEVRPASSQADPCVEDARTLCIDGQPGDSRFELRAHYSTSQGGGLSGEATAVPLEATGMDRGGLFAFFAADNPELFVKVLDGCKVNGKMWVFVSAGTNAGFSLTVRDTRTGASRQYSNPDLKVAAPVQDTAALPCS